MGKPLESDLLDCRTQPVATQPNQQLRNSSGGSFGLVAGIIAAILVLGGAACVMIALLGVAAWVLLSRGDKLAQQPASGNRPVIAEAPQIPPGIESTGARAISGGPVAQASVAGLPVVATHAAAGYRFEPGLDYTYAYRVNTESRGIKAAYFGSVNFRLNEEGRLPPVAGDDEPSGERTGSAFVVHSDGLLATSARLVRNSREVRVTLGSETHAAEVVGFDERHDLALLRVPGTKLAALPLAEADEPRIAEEVRALGFPQAGVLGANVKVLVGTISGFVNEPDERMLQVDMPFDLGYRGGPLLDARGEVVGVQCNALRGEGFTNVTLSAPGRFLRELLRSKGISTGPAGAKPKPAQPAELQSLTAAVALVRVTPAPGGTLRKLDYWGFALANGADQTRLAQGGGGKMEPNQQDESGHVWISPKGEVVSAVARAGVPLLGLPLAEIAFEDLPPKGAPEWGHSGVRMIAVARSLEGGSPLRPAPKKPQPGDPPRAVPNVRLVPALEQVKYRLTVETADTLEFDRSYYLETLSRDPVVHVRVTGQGAVVWDKKQGVVKSSKCSLSIIDKTVGIQVNTPAVVEVTLRGATPGNTLAKELQVSGNEERNRTWPGLSGKPALPPRPRRGPGEEELDTLLGKLGSAKSFDALPLLMELSTRRVIPERRGEVAAALDQHLLTGEDPVRHAALAAVKHWKTEQNVPALRQMLDSPSSLIRSTAMESLAAISKSPDVAETIAKRMEISSDRHAAARALQSMGAVAEQAVWQFMGAKDMQLHFAACEIISQIGTEKSLVRLKPILETLPQGYAAYLRVSLQAIEKRRFAAGPQPEHVVEPILAGIIGVLSSKDATTQNLDKALRDLQSLQPIASRRDEVSKLIDPLLRATDQRVRLEALKCMSRWGTDFNVPTLVNFLESNTDRRDRSLVMIYLAFIGTPQAAVALSERLPDKNDRGTAKSQLQRMGPVAEEAIFVHLDSADELTFSAACQVLREVGMQKSLEKLAPLRSPQGLRGVEAAATHRVIEERLKKP
jgi:S1-C subfamily serine protease/HEAT repeat protein